MLHNESVNWEIFNIPPVQPVQYYSILKKKREFSQLIKQYDAHVIKHGQLHYCGIVPKNTSSSLSNKYELLIVFFDDVPNTSFIGFRIKVSKETYIHESNSILLFLKNRKTGLYFVNDNCIHVHCGENAWELFYLLYGVYLRQFVLTVIGTQFFYHFVYSLCIQNEKQLLMMLFRGSKVIRVSKMSIYYRIHRKRKISVTDLIHMTLNLPESKRCVLSFDPKKSLSHSDFTDRNFYTSGGSKIHVSKLDLKKMKKQFQETLHDISYTNPIRFEKKFSTSDPIFTVHSKLVSSKFKTCEADIKSKHISTSNTILKRKFDEIKNDEYDIQSTPTASKFLKISDFKEANQWEQYASLKPYTLKSYSSLLRSKYFVPNLFKNSKSSHDINSLSNLYNNQDWRFPSIALMKENKNSLIVEKTSEVFNLKNIDRNSKTDNNYENVSNFRENMLSNTLINTNSNLLNSIPIVKILHQENYEIPPAQSISFSRNNIKLSSSTSLSSLKFVNQDEANSDPKEDIFVTAAGKNINISNNAMLAAQRFIEGIFQDEKHQKLDEKVNCNPIKKKHFIKVPELKNNSVFLKSTTSDIPLDKTSVVSSCAVRTSKDFERLSKEVDLAHLKSINDSYESDAFDNEGSFSTAAGKNITVSEAAMKTAQKLIQDTFKEEETIIPSTSGIYSIHKNKTCKNVFKDIGCPSKRMTVEEIDADIDKSLVEKLFHDTLFDEKDLKTSESMKDKDSDIVSEPKRDSNLPTRKLKKSLGGRRSMRFYSDAI